LPLNKDLFLRSWFTPEATSNRGPFFSQSSTGLFIYERGREQFWIWCLILQNFLAGAEGQTKYYSSASWGTALLSSVVAWPCLLHQGDRESKTMSWIWSHPVSPGTEGSWNVFWSTVVLPYCRLQQEKQQGSLWCAGLWNMCVNPC